MIVFDSDDFGCNHVISDMCQSHDCRDALDRLHNFNPNFKATLFTIPGELTPEMAMWCHANKGWIELAVHGFYHTSNYECEKMTYEEFDTQMDLFKGMTEGLFVKGFKAPGWQISDDIYKWLGDHDWWVADQDYNTPRRPLDMKSYINRNNTFYAHKGTTDQDWTEINGVHTHTWNCVGNGIYELEEDIKSQIANETEFKFISEVLA